MMEENLHYQRQQSVRREASKERREEIEATWTTYTVYIKTGGLMESPGWVNEDLMTIRAPDPDTAVKRWLAANPRWRDPTYLTEGQKGKGWSFWGWSIFVGQFTEVERVRLDIVTDPGRKPHRDELLRIKALNKLVREGKLTYDLKPIDHEQVKEAEELVRNGAENNFFRSASRESDEISTQKLGSESLLDLYGDLILAEHVSEAGLQGTKDVRVELLKRLGEYDLAHTNPRD